jgi:hypothetical protein
LSFFVWLLYCLSFFLWSLHCLSFDLRLCITPLVSPNLSHRWPRIYSVCDSQKFVFLLAWLNAFLSREWMSRNPGE